MEYIEYINFILGRYTNYITGVLIVLNVIFIFATIRNRIKLNRITRRYIALTDGIKNKQLEDILEDYYAKVKEVINKNEIIEQKLNKLEGDLRLCIQKVGVVRYNAFDDVGSDLSFAITLLDSNDNGVIINGIYSRESSTTYAKPIIGGQSKYALSAEELQSLELAKKNHREREYSTK